MSKRTLLISHALGLSLILLGVHTPSATAQEVDTTTSDPAAASAVTLTATLGPSKDNTLYEDPDGLRSNGAGQYFFVGNTNQSSNSIRRGLIKFDVAAGLPAFATIVSATLHLTMSQTAAGPQPIRLHRVTADWGEGTSDAGSAGGGGAPATPGDATWIHTFYTSTLWAASGGDFVITASATTTVGSVGAYAWSAPDVASDVQSWLSAPAANYGWLLSGNESTLMTAKRFNSKEHVTPSARPALVITYTVPYAIYLPVTIKQTGVVTP